MLGGREKLPFAVPSRFFNFILSGATRNVKEMERAKGLTARHMTIQNAIATRATLAPLPNAAGDCQLATCSMFAKITTASGRNDCAD
jgi:hypothetical protein